MNIIKMLQFFRGFLPKICKEVHRLMAPESRMEADDDGGGGLVSHEKYQAQLQKIDELNQIIEGLFTNEIRHISWKEEVANLTNEKQEVESKYADAVSTYSSEKAYTKCKHAAEIKAMKSEHSLMVAELEDAYEDRLISLTNKITIIEKKHQVTEECQLKESSGNDEQHQAQITELVSSSHNSENKFKKEIDDLKGEVDTSEKMRHCMLAQQEEEYEKELSQQSFEYQKRRKDKQNEIDEVNIQVQKLVAKRAWLERQAKELKSQVIDIQNDFLEETQRCKKLDGEIDRIKCILKQREDEMEQMKAQMNATNVEKNHLEKELYITKTRCEEIEMERAPLEQTIKQQKDKATDLTEQLHESQSEIDALQRIIEVHEQKVRSEGLEIRSLRGSVRNLDRKIKSFEGNLIQLAGISDEKTLRNQVKTSYHIFVKGEVIRQNKDTKA